MTTTPNAPDDWPAAYIVYTCPSCRKELYPFDGICPHCDYDYSAPYDWLDEGDADDWEGDEDE